MSRGKKFLSFLTTEFGQKCSFCTLLTKVFSPKIFGQKYTFCTLLTTTVLTLFDTKFWYYSSGQKFWSFLTTEFGQKRSFVHFWPRYFCSKFLIKNTLFVHFWPRLFWPSGQKISGRKGVFNFRNLSFIEKVLN